MSDDRIKRAKSLLDPGRTWADRYRGVRAATEALCQTLQTEDYVVQSMPNVSPTRWHLAHTTWFWEAFLLPRIDPAYVPFHPDYHFLFNSYYYTVGQMFDRPRRGLLTRPTVGEVYEYRKAVDERVLRAIETDGAIEERGLEYVFQVGLNHEQQHQELMLTDIKHVFAQNPLCPVFRETLAPAESGTDHPAWTAFEGGTFEIGAGYTAFCFDNETPVHKRIVEPFGLADRLVTNGEYLEFIEDGGYGRVDLWLSDGWHTINHAQWTAPIYWVNKDGAWFEFTLSGLRELRLDEPVCHVSHYEADAFAAWAGARLPTEFEWEVAGRDADAEGTFAESESFHPRPAGPAGGPRQLFGDLWEWTRSAYLPYPGFQPLEGSLGEYNGKFMSNQIVLRGGSCATPASHIRATYRNFFQPDSRWQFTGIRLAKDV